MCVVLCALSICVQKGKHQPSTRPCSARVPPRRPASQKAALHNSCLRLTTPSIATHALLMQRQRHQTVAKELHARTHDTMWLANMSVHKPERVGVVCAGRTEELQRAESVKRPLEQGAADLSPVLP